MKEITPPGTPPGAEANGNNKNGRSQNSSSTPDSARRPPDLPSSLTPPFSPIGNGTGLQQETATVFRSPLVPVPPSPPLPFPNGPILLGNGHNIVPAPGGAPGGERNQPTTSRQRSARASGHGSHRTLTITNTEQTSCVYVVSPGHGPTNGTRNQRQSGIGGIQAIDPHMNQVEAPHSSRTPRYRVHGDVSFSVIGNRNTVHVHIPHDYEEFVPVFRR